jgi:hypothetical protein
MSADHTTAFARRSQVDPLNLRVVSAYLTVYINDVILIAGTLHPKHRAQSAILFDQRNIVIAPQTISHSWHLK